jgi:hypothetical protein
MSNITDVIEYLLQQHRKDLAEVVVQELKGTTIVQNPTPLRPLTIPSVGDDPRAPYRIVSAVGDSVIV